MEMGLRAGTTVVVLVLAGGNSPAPKSWDPMAEEKGNCLLETREAHPGAGTGRALGRKEGWGCPGKRPAAAVRKEGGAKSGGEPRGPARAPASRPNVLSPVLRPCPPARPPAQVPPPDGTLR